MKQQKKQSSKVTIGLDLGDRRLSVSAAQYILGPFGPESALRCYGLRLAAEGTARAKKRATVAVARKLAVLLLSLWKSQRLYEPFPQAA